MSRNRRTLPLRLVVALMVVSGLASGTTITFVTPSGSATADGSVNAMAVFSTGNGSLTLTLTDLLSNPASVGQLLSSVQFSLGSSLSGSASMSSTANERTVNGDQSFTQGSSVSTGWALQISGGSAIICVICTNNGTPAPTATPSHLIIGSGPYTNANGSIAGNKPHNAFLDESATFTISDSTITSATVASNVVFGFGTQFGSEVNAQPTASETSVPETRTMLMIGSGLILLGSLKRLQKSQL